MAILGVKGCEVHMFKHFWLKDETKEDLWQEATNQHITLAKAFWNYKLKTQSTLVFEIFEIEVEIESTNEFFYKNVYVAIWTSIVFNKAKVIWNVATYSLLLVITCSMNHSNLLVFVKLCFLVLLVRFWY
jgi:hypothetical protein